MPLFIGMIERNSELRHVINFINLYFKEFRMTG